jgi:hypothetical protein
MKAITTALLAGFAMASGSVAASSAPFAGSAHRQYDLSSLADRKLLHFDMTHPDCEMWTDWRKLCSRMGPDGTSTCRTDPLHPAKPSEPFCAMPGQSSGDTLAQGLSRGRYCAQFVDPPSPEQTGPRGFCAIYRPGRPFGGERLAQMATPDCLKWTHPGLVLLDGRRRRVYAFMCTRWSHRVQCPRPVGGGGAGHWTDYCHDSPVTIQLPRVGRLL